MRGTKLTFHCLASAPIHYGIPRLEDESRRVGRGLEFLDLGKHGIDDERVFVLKGESIAAKLSRIAVYDERELRYPPRSGLIWQKGGRRPYCFDAFLRSSLSNCRTASE